MDKYIKADDLIDRIYPVDPENDGSDGCTIVMQNLKLSSQEIEAIVNEIPAADVAPVVHGRWVNVLLHREKPIRMDALCALCSNCKKESDRTAFCPHCGAKMDKEG